MSAPATGATIAVLSDAEAEYREQEAERALDRKLAREYDAQLSYGMAKGAFPCGHCGRFKSRPSTRCDHCGTDPVATDARTYDRAHGYA